MTNIDLYPLQDNYESKLSQPYDGTSSVIYVDSIPTATLPWWAKVLFTINPWTSFAQTVEVDWWSAWQLNVSSTTVEKWNGINYSTTSHGAKSPIIISDNFAYWKEIATNVNSKADVATPTFTGYVWLPTYADATARDAAIPTPTGKELVIVNWDIQHYNSTTAQREIADTGTPTPNASTTVAGKVEKSTPAEVTAGTSTGGTGAELFVWPSELKTVTDAITSSISWTILVWWFWDWVYWDVTINSWTTTLTSDMYYNNLTLTSPWVLNPNWFRVFIKGTFSGNGTIRRNGNNGTAASWASVWVWGTVLNQGSMNAEIAWAWTNVSWVTANPSYHNVNGASAGTSWNGSNGAWSVPVAWVSTRWPRYNVGMTLSKLLELLPIAASWLNSLNTLFVQYKGIGGWAWGWQWWPWDGFVAWSYGGGSWSNWGTIYIQASIWNFTGLIESLWWAAGAGSATNPVWWTNRWWWAWAAGWSGWVVIAIGKTFTSLYWTLTLTWGTGWTWWQKNGTWVAWTSWSTWPSWVFIQITTL